MTQTLIQSQARKALNSADLSALKLLIARDTNNELDDYVKIIKKNFKSLLFKCLEQQNTKTLDEILTLTKRKLPKLRYYNDLVLKAVQGNHLNLIEHWSQEDPDIYKRILKTDDYFKSCLSQQHYNDFKTILQKTGQKLTDLEYYKVAFEQPKKHIDLDVIDDILSEKPHALNYALETSFFVYLSISKEEKNIEKFHDYVKLVKDDLFYAQPLSRSIFDNLIAYKHIDNLTFLLKEIPAYRPWLKKRVEFGMYQSEDKMISHVLALSEKIDLDSKINFSIDTGIGKKRHKI